MPSDSPPRGPETLIALLYPAGILVALDQVGTVMLQVQSMELPVGSLLWRLNGFGELTGRSSGLILADVLLFLPALLLAQQGVLRTLASINLFWATCETVGLGFFLRDASLFKDPAGASNPGAIASTVMSAAIITLLSVGLMVWAGVTILRHERPTGSKEEREPAPLVVGQPGAGEESRSFVPGIHRFLPLLAAAALVILLDQLVALLGVRGAPDLHLPLGRVQLLTRLASQSGELLPADILLVVAVLGLANPLVTRILSGLQFGTGALAVYAALRFLLDMGHLAGSVGLSDVVAERLAALVRILGWLLLLVILSWCAGRELRRSVPPGQ